MPEKRDKKGKKNGSPAAAEAETAKSAAPAAENLSEQKPGENSEDDEKAPILAMRVAPEFGRQDTDAAADGLPAAIDQSQPAAEEAQSEGATVEKLRLPTAYEAACVEAQEATYLDSLKDNDLDFAPEAVPSGPLSHGWVPSATDEEPTAQNAEQSALTPCPDCGTMLEPFQMCCHNCYFVLSDLPVPSADNLVDDSTNLEDAFQNWLDKGKMAFKEECYGEAQACFQEALTRCRVLPNARVREIEVRRELAQALEKSEKNPEATEQYVALSQLDKRSIDRGDEFTKRAKQLSLSTMDILSAVDKHASFRPPTFREIELVPLYCADCKRLLLEAEVYALRKGKICNVRCFCGFEGIPVVRSDAKHLRALKTAAKVRDRKALMLQAASDYFPEGRKQKLAVALAALLGTFGVHKFYLGERLPGILYAVFFFTGLPTVISLFEAINYSQMSRITFNLMFNIELVIARMPAQEEEPSMEDHSDVFSMEISGEADDFADQFCSTEN